MKKLLALVLTFALVLSFGALAYAEGSPVKEVSVNDLPAESEAVENAEISEGAAIIPNKDLTAEQEEAVNEAIEAVVEDGSLPVDSFTVEAEEEATISIELEEDAVVYVIYPDGTVVKLLAKDLVVLEDGRYEINVDGSCVVVIAKAA